MGNILEEIIEQTKSDLIKRVQEVSLRELESFEPYERRRRDFRGALRGDRLTVIAEIKKASPSRGVIRRDFNLLEIAGSYVDGGASALSVLTDKPFFQGDLKYLTDISKEFDIPLLRKDFIVDPYQVKEARAFGADAVLFIVAVTSGSQLGELLQAADEFGLDALVECYSLEEVDSLDWESLSVFGVNNRDLRTFEVDLHRGIELLQRSPDRVVRVSESGIATAADLLLLEKNGIDAALIGEIFMRSPSPGGALKAMLGEFKNEVKEE